MKIAVVSDMHWHAVRDKDSSFLVHGVTRRRKLDPVLSVLDLILEREISAEYLVCPGDITDSCDLVGIEHADRSLVSIGRALGVAHTFVTVGNHDVDSRDLHHTGPFAPLRKHATMVPSNLPTSRSPFWQDGFYLHLQPPTALLVLNSSAMHSSLDEAKRGALSEETLDLLSKRLDTLSDKACVRVAVAHHHPHLHEDLELGTDDVMRNGSELVALLEAHGFQLIIHGHKHHPKLSYAAGGTASPAVLASGSIAAIANRVLATNVRNLFHVVELGAGRVPFCHGSGVVETWEFNAGRGWNPATRSSAGVPHHSGFGCRLPPQDLAEQVFGALQGQRKRWSELLQLLPYLEYAIPKDLDKTFSLLRSQYQVRTFFDEFGDPSEVCV